MQLILTFKSSFSKKYIIVKLYDDPAVKKWFDHFKPIYSFSGVRPLGASYDKSTRRRTVFENITCRKHWQSIREVVENIEFLGFKMPFDVPEKFDHKQQTLNDLHRFFTSNVNWFWYKNSLPNPYDKKFIVPHTVDSMRWFKMLVPIDKAVRGLESSTYSLYNSKFVDTTYPVHALGALPDTDELQWIDFTEEEQKLNYTYLNNKDDIQVLLNSSMLGKSVLQSFYDHDNLLANDCTGRLGSQGGFLIDINQNRRKIYESDKFQHWVAGHKLTVEELPLEFPIGFVAHTSMPLNQYSYKNLEKIEFIE